MATEFIKENEESALLLDMGLGKTVISLTAIKDLLFDSFDVSKVLIVAPLRVARDTWKEEIEKWSHLDILKYSVAIGSEKERIKSLEEQADIYLINRENVDWLINKSELPFNYDMIVIDELSSFKSHRSIKLLGDGVPVSPTILFIFGLTFIKALNLFDL